MAENTATGCFGFTRGEILTTPSKKLTISREAVRIDESHREQVRRRQMYLGGYKVHKWVRRMIFGNSASSISINSGRTIVSRPSNANDENAMHGEEQQISETRIPMRGHGTVKAGFGAQVV